MPFANLASAIFTTHQLTDIAQILSNTSHRPYPLPTGPWRYYQEWNKALFLHWAVPFDTLRSCIPASLNIDTFNNTCYVSLVAFTMENIRPKYFPSVSLVSDFDEINLRTYIDNDGKKGVYFLNIEAKKAISAFLARSLSGLPYEKSAIKRTARTYISTNKRKGFYLDAAFEVSETLDNKTPLDKWLTERYCLYFEMAGAVYRYDVHHKEWPLKKTGIKRLNLNYKVGNLTLSGRHPNLVHYSDGVKVIAWGRQKN